MLKVKIVDDPVVELLNWSWGSQHERHQTIQDDEEDEVELSDDDEDGGRGKYDGDDDDDEGDEGGEQRKKKKRIKRNKFIDDVADVDDDEEDDDEDYDDEVAPGEKFIEEDGGEVPRDHLAFRRRAMEEEKMLEVEDEDAVNEYYRQKDRQVHYMVRVPLGTKSCATVSSWQGRGCC